jgi:ABC-type multidrug transport system ATPase subunit
MCTSIGIIERGKLLYCGSIKDAYARVRAGQRIAVTFEPGGVPPATVREALLRDARVSRVIEPSPDAPPQNGAGGAAPPSRLVIELTPGEHGHHFLIEALVASGARVASFAPETVKLEDAFLKLTTGALQ